MFSKVIKSRANSGFRRKTAVFSVQSAVIGAHPNADG
jgi:hypothetical protein